jgi:hypothetical protein
MKLYRFSPIQNLEELLLAVTHTHLACCQLCIDSLGALLPVAGNIGIFCHYDNEYAALTKIREQLTEPSDNINQKYFRLYEPIVVPANGAIPETRYTYLYIRKPDPYRHHVGDVDFYLESNEYSELKESLLKGSPIKGARIFDRSDLDMIELHNPDVDALAYVSEKTMTEKVRAKINLPG